LANINSVAAIEFSCEKPDATKLRKCRVERQTSLILRCMKIFPQFIRIANK